MKENGFDLPPDLIGAVDAEFAFFEKDYPFDFLMSKVDIPTKKAMIQARKMNSAVAEAQLSETKDELKKLQQAVKKQRL